MRSYLGACILVLLAMAPAGCRDSAACAPGVGVSYAPSDTTIHVAETYGTTFQVLYVGCGTLSARFIWQSSKPFVATVDSTGRVTGIAAGQATISVAGQPIGELASTQVTVVP